MKAYNQASPKTPEEAERAMKSAWKACAELPSSFSFNAIASVDAIDSDREKIDVDSIKKHMDDYIRYGGNVNWEHRDLVVGTVWDWAPIQVNGRPGVQIWGNLFGGRDIYDQARKIFVDGSQGVSLGGQAKPTGYKCDSEGCYVSRTVNNLYEISITANPANPYAQTIAFSKGEFKKSKRMGVDLSLVSYRIHRDYSTCPVMKVRKALEDEGFVGLHATKDGVVVPGTCSDVIGYLTGCKGYVLSKSADGMLVQDRAWATERAFKDGFSKGYIDADGMVSPTMPEGTFKDLYRKGIIWEDGDRFRVQRLVLRARRGPPDAPGVDISVLYQRSIITNGEL